MEFLITELQLGQTFAARALGTKSERARLRNRLNARKAYEVARRKTMKVVPDKSEAQKIRTGLEQLKADLKLLGETNLK